MTVYFIADTHFNHKNIIKYCDRPFSNVKEMNYYMIKKWNETVQPEDIVWHLGDFGFFYRNFKNAKWLRSQLNGTINIVLGNHDKYFKHKQWEELFNIVVQKKYDYTLTYKTHSISCILSHRPLHKHNFGENMLMLNIHGHIHNNGYDNKKDLATRNYYLNISCEMLDYTPISEEEILKRYLTSRINYNYYKEKYNDDKEL